MIALYRPGTSLIHRAPAGLKLGVLFVAAIALSVVPYSPMSIAALGAGVLMLYLIAGFGPLTFVRQLWQTRWIVLLLAVTLLIFSTPSVALINTGRVVAILLLAGVMTLTTRPSDLLATVEWTLSPLRPLGVRPERVGLVLVLTIAVIPVVADLARRVREAQHARGVRLGVRFVLPLMVLSLRHADEMGDALAARGLA